MNKINYTVNPIITCYIVLINILNVGSISSNLAVAQIVSIVYNMLLYKYFKSIGSDHNNKTITVQKGGPLIYIEPRPRRAWV